MKINWRWLAGAALFLLVAAFVLKNPAHAADEVRTLGAKLGVAGDRLVQFVTQVLA